MYYDNDEFKEVYEEDENEDDPNKKKRIKKSIKLSSKEYILGKSMNFKFFIFLKFSSFKSIKQSNNKGIE